MQINLKNIYFLLGVLVTLAAIYLIYAEVFPTTQQIPVKNSIERTINTPSSITEIQETKLEQAGFFNLSYFYKKYPNSEYKIRFIDSTYNEELGWHCKMGDLGKEFANVSILNPNDECGYGETDIVYSYDRRYFVSRLYSDSQSRPDDTFVGIRLYDFDSNTTYSIDNSAVLNKLSDVNKILEGDNPGVDIDFEFSPNPQNKTFAVYFSAPYRGSYGILLYKIDDETRSVRLVYDHKLPTNGDELAILGWDVKNYNHFYIGEISSYAYIPGTDAKFIDKGIYKYVDVTDNPVSLTLSDRTDFYQYDYVNTDFLDYYITDSSQEYIDFTDAVKGENISTDGIYPINYHFRDLYPRE